MTFTALLASITAHDATQTVSIPDGWMQGRTTYGGLTAALCLAAAEPLSAGKPLRSAQVAFVGPAAGTLHSVPTLLREGKSTNFVSVRMTGEAGIVAEAIFAFGAARASALDFTSLPAPDVPSPDDTLDFFRRGGPKFKDQFDVKLADGGLPLSGAAEADIILWLRHRDDAARNDAVALLALADAPPPAAMSMMTAARAMSSMTWMAEFLTDRIETDDRWFLARHTAQNAAQGYSSQAMRLWNRQGQPIMIGRQTIAIFD